MGGIRQKENPAAVGNCYQTGGNRDPVGNRNPAQASLIICCNNNNNYTSVLLSLSNLVYIHVYVLFPSAERRGGGVREMGGIRQKENPAAVGNCYQTGGNRDPAAVGNCNLTGGNRDPVGNRNPAQASLLLLVVIIIIIRQKEKKLAAAVVGNRNSAVVVTRNRGAGEGDGGGGEDGILHVNTREICS